MQVNRGKIRQWTFVWVCTKISRNNSRRYDNQIMESTNANRHNYPKQLTGHHNSWQWIRNMSVNWYCNFRRYKRDQERGRNDFEIYRSYNKNTALVECKKRKVTSNTKGATGTIWKSFRKSLRNTPRNHVKELDKTATLGTAHMFLKLLM
jgi:hypothetical protein